ncbi:MAG: hypothetical protein Fur0010_23020 [Bdellovibrio sp.]
MTARNRNEIIEKSMQENVSNFRACNLKHVNKEQPKENLSADDVILPTGKTTKIKIEGTKNKKLSACLSKVIQHIQYPVHREGAEVEPHQPINFILKKNYGPYC